ncbi:MAG: hypothetical protein ACK56I_04125, partial [bacterium]
CCWIKQIDEKKESAAFWSSPPNCLQKGFVHDSSSIQDGCRLGKIGTAGFAWGIDSPGNDSEYKDLAY